MNQYINRAEIKGRVGSVRIQEVGDGKVARIAVVTEKCFTNRDGISTFENTWHCVTAWNHAGIADIEKIATGDTVHATGELRTRRLVTADGAETSYAEIVADKLEIVS